MLILTRKLGESVVIGDNVKITVVEVGKHQIKLGVEAPKNIAVHREEVYKKIKAENELAAISNVVNLNDFSKQIKTGKDIETGLFCQNGKT